MARKKKIAGVIEAVRYTDEGQIDLVRAYERHGFVFSDLIVLDRTSLYDRLQDGAHFVVGERKLFYGNDFDLAEPIRLDGKKDAERIIAGKSQGNQDHLAGAPEF